MCRWRWYHNATGARTVNRAIERDRVWRLKGWQLRFMCAGLPRVPLGLVVAFYRLSDERLIDICSLERQDVPAINP